MAQEILPTSMFVWRLGKPGYFKGELLVIPSAQLMRFQPSYEVQT